MTWFDRLITAVRWLRSLQNGPLPRIVGDATKAADWIAHALSSSGYRADYSLESLREVDRFFDEHTVDGRARPDGLLAKNLGQRLFAIGAYCGEAIRRRAGGTWNGDDADLQAEINIALTLPDGSVLWPVQRVMKRFTGGSEESLYAYAVAVLDASATDRR
jgi:hypothetical protein